MSQSMAPPDCTDQSGKGDEGSVLASERGFGKQNPIACIGQVRISDCFLICKWPDIIRHMTCRISLANWNHYFSDSLVTLHEWLPGIGNWMILPSKVETGRRGGSKANLPRFFGGFGHLFTLKTAVRLDRKNGIRITQNARKSAAPRLHRRSQIKPQRGCHGGWHQACEAISDPINWIGSLYYGESAPNHIIR